MKTVLSVLCCLGMLVMLAGCDNGDDGGSSGGPGRWPTVSFTVDDDGNVTCLNADSNVITTRQTCIWNCAFYHIDKPRYVQLWFDEGLVCTPSGIDEETGEVTETCEPQIALVRESFKECRLDNPPPY